MAPWRWDLLDVRALKQLCGDDQIADEIEVIESGLYVIVPDPMYAGRADVYGYAIVLLVGGGMR